MYVGWNGTICKDSEAVISIYDHGFLYGIGLFETFRTYDGEPFLLEEHMARLQRGCQELRIAHEPVHEIVSTRQLLRELLEANGLKDGYIRYTVSAGDDILGLPAGDYAKPNIIIYVKPLPPFADELYVHGKPLQLLRTRRNSPEGEVRLKSLHYMNNILAKRELQQYEAARTSGAEGLMLDVRGYAAEGIVSNVFLIRDGICCTPALDTGILPGITRAFVLDLARRLGVTVEEGHYTWDDILHAEELFVTNSIQEIVPVTSLLDEQGNRFAIGGGTVGVVTSLLLRQYRSAVAGNDIS